MRALHRRQQPTLHGVELNVSVSRSAQGERQTHLISPATIISSSPTSGRTDLPGHANVPHPALLHHIMKRLHLTSASQRSSLHRSAHSLFDRCVIIESSISTQSPRLAPRLGRDSPMTLQHVDIVKLEPLQAILHAIKDMLCVSI